MSPSQSIIIDLDASRRESAHPDGIPVRLGGDDFLLPAELPVDVFDPFLDPNFDLTGIIRDAMDQAKMSEGASLESIIIDVLFERPTIPVQLVNAIFAAFAILFGDEQYARFKAHRPSLPDYGRLARGLFRAYGASLGEAFASPAPSALGGATQKPTSPASTSSTPDSSGADQEPATAS